MLLDPADLSDSANAVVVAGIGAPTRSLSPASEIGLGPGPVLAYEAMKSVTTIAGINLAYLMPGETGAMNYLTIFRVASERNIPVVDADGNGRSVPELATGLHPIYKIPTSPLVLASKAGDIIIAYLANPLDSAGAEAIGRAASILWTGASFSTWITSIATIKKCMVPNSMSKTEKVGKAMREARTIGKDPVKEVTTITGGRELLRGKIQKIEMRTVEGFAFGRTTVEGIAEHKDKTVIIDVKNDCLAG
jgi:hypothetical protein